MLPEQLKQIYKSSIWNKLVNFSSFSNEKRQKMMNEILEYLSSNKNTKVVHPNTFETVAYFSNEGLALLTASSFFIGKGK